MRCSSDENHVGYLNWTPCIQRAWTRNYCLQVFINPKCVYILPLSIFPFPLCIQVPVSKTLLCRCILSHFSSLSLFLFYFPVHFFSFFLSPFFFLFFLSFSFFPFLLHFPISFFLDIGLSCVFCHFCSVDVFHRFSLYYIILFFLLTKSLFFIIIILFSSHINDVYTLLWMYPHEREISQELTGDFWWFSICAC